MRPVHQQLKLLVPDYFCVSFCFVCGSFIRHYTCSAACKLPLKTYATLYLLFLCVFIQGACILNMLKDFLSEDTFRKGIIRYLKKFSYRNAKNDDLWHSLSNVSHQLSYRRLLVSLNSDKLIRKAYKQLQCHTTDVYCTCHTARVQQVAPVYFLWHLANPRCCTSLAPGVQYLTCFSLMSLFWFTLHFVFCFQTFRDFIIPSCDS